MFTIAIAPSSASSLCDLELDCSAGPTPTLAPAPPATPRPRLAPSTSGLLRLLRLFLASHRPLLYAAAETDCVAVDQHGPVGEGRGSATEI